MRTGNPALRSSTLNSLPHSSARMTARGAATKTGLLLAILVAAASYIWLQLPNIPQSAVPYLMFGSMFVSLILSVAIIIQKSWAPYLAPFFVLAEGVLVGTLSALSEILYPGMVTQAVALTLTTLLMMLIAYRSGWIQVTEKFKLGIFAATFALSVVYMTGFVLSFFDYSVPFINEASPLGIGFSVVVTAVAALNLTLDFDAVDQLENAGAPRYMEWYCAFALVLSLIWLYVEVLRLLSKVRNQR